MKKKIKLNLFPKKMKKIFAALNFIFLIFTFNSSYASIMNILAFLSGSKVVPPNISTGTGHIVATLDTNTNLLTFTLRFSGLQGTTTSAALYGPARPDTNGPLQIPLSGFPVGVTSGVYRNASYIGQGDVENILTGRYYLSIQTTSFPAGEIRSQLGVLVSFADTLSGSEQVPPNGSPGTGIITGSLNTANGVFMYNLSFSNLQGLTTTAGLYNAAAGNNGPLVIPFSDFQSGVSSGMHADTLNFQQEVGEQILQDATYVNILSALFPGGELRAQIEQDTVEQLRVIVTGAVTGNGTYSTLKEAFDAINSGPQTGANIIIYIQQDTTAELTAVLNAGTWASLRIEPVGHRIVSGAMSPGSPLIDISGADNVTIDGLNNGGNSLTISNTTVSTNTNTSTIRFINDATNNIITNCKILGSSNSAVGTNAGNILFSSGTVTGNDNNTISNCEIGPAGSNLPSKGIYFAGTTSSQTLNNSGNVISGCTIHDYFHPGNTSSGIYSKNGTRQSTIQNNKFYQSAARVLTTNSVHSAITIENNNANGTEFQITGNRIGYADSSGNGTYTISGASNTFIGIELNLGTAALTTVDGNIIAGINHSSNNSGVDAASPSMAIYIQNGLVSVTGNTIGSMNSTGSIVYTSGSGTQSGFIGIGNYSSSNSVISGNSIGGISASNSSTGASNIYCIAANTNAASTFTCTNNIIGGPVVNSIQSNSTSTNSVVNGIRYTDPSGTVTGNIIRNLSALGGTGTNGSASVLGIRINAGSSTNHFISQNQIHTLKNTNQTLAAAVTGIHTQINPASTITIERNLIHSFVVQGNDGVEHRMLGIHLQTGTGMVKNNMIRLGVDGQGNGVNHGARIFGINEDGTNNQIVFNSVYIGGNPTSASDTVSTYAFYSDVIVNARTFRNNIFYNARSNIGSNAKHYAVRVGGSNPEPDGLNIGNNVYLADGNGGLLGFYNSAVRNDLSAWEQGLPRDSTGFERDPRFLNPSGDISSFNLHINPNVPTIIESNGFDIPLVTDDFDGEDRDTLTKVDIGADAGDFIQASNSVLKIKGFIEGFYNSASNTQTSDTVTIEKRSTLSPYPVILTVRVVITEDGVVFIQQDTIDQFWLVLKHRNSIETWSAAPVMINEDDTTFYDFTTAASQAYGDNLIQVDNAPVTFAVFSGDGNADGIIDANDLLGIDNAAAEFKKGYSIWDLNNDGQIDGSDMLIADNNASRFVSVVRP